jgi:hypothetical protein
MTEKKAEHKPEKFVVKYVGEHQGVVVPGFFDGNGVYAKKGSQHTFHEPDEIELAKNLVENNPNFEEVSK